MSLSSMPPGALLQKTLQPYSPTSQIANIKKDLRRLASRTSTRTQTGQTQGEGNQENVGNPSVPKPELSAEMATVEAAFTGEGVYTPSLILTLPTDMAQERGFIKYRVRINVDGKGFVDYDGDPYPLPTYNVVKVPLLSQSTAADIQVQAACTSAFYGDGVFSDPLTVTLPTQTVVPAAPTSVTATAIAGGALIKWAAPPETEYKYSNIYLAVNSVTPPTILLGTSSNGSFQYLFDFALWSGTYAGVFVTHVNNTLGESARTYCAVTPSKIGTPQIGAGAVTTTELGSGAVHTGNITAGAVTTTELGANAVTTAKLALLAVDSTILAGGAVTTAKIAAGAVTTTELGAGAVTDAKVASGLDASKLTVGTLPIARLGAGSITSNELGAGSVISGKIGAGAVGTTEIGANVITTGKMAPGSIGTTELQGTCVTTAKIANDAVTATQILNGTITDAKVASGLDASKLTTGTLPIARIGAGNITSNELGASSVIAGKIAGGAINSGLLFGAGVVNNAALAASGLDASKLTVGTLPAARIATGALDYTKLDGATLGYLGNTEMTGDPVSVFGSLRVYEILPVTAPMLEINSSNLQTNGYFRIIGASNPIFFIDQDVKVNGLRLAAGTAVADHAPLKFTTGSNLTTAETGAVEYDGQAMYMTPVVSRRSIMGAEHVIKVDTNFNNSSAENSMFSHTFPANELKAQRVIRLHLRGVYSTLNSLATCVWRYKFGGTTLYGPNITGAATNAPWSATVDITIRTIGAPGTFIWYVAMNANNTLRDGVATAAANVTTNASVVLECTTQFTTISPTNSVTLQQAWIEDIN